MNLTQTRWCASCASFRRFPGGYFKIKHGRRQWLCNDCYQKTRPKNVVSDV